MMRLRDASNDTERNNELTKERFTIASPKSSQACDRARRRANGGPRMNSDKRCCSRGRACGAADCAVTSGDNNRRHRRHRDPNRADRRSAIGGLPAAPQVSVSTVNGMSLTTTGSLLPHACLSVASAMDGKPRRPRRPQRGSPARPVRRVQCRAPNESRLLRAVGGGIPDTTHGLNPALMLPSTSSSSPSPTA